MQAFQDIFISYGRRDSLAFASRLNRRLVDLGFTVWFDYDDIPLGVDYQKQIDDGIERADNFVFVMSPHSINSPYCGLELELALKHNKRIIPWLHVERISYETWLERNPQGTEAEWQDYQGKGLHDHFQNMHPLVRKINWIYGREDQDNFEAAFAGLLEICDRSKDYVHQHTLLLAKALDWERNQKRSSYLLIGEERLKAEEWLKVRFPDSQPPCLPTALHCEFITESRKNADNLMTEVFL
ncbi:MAG: toll/interleukin-1 receptor domain-containing protein, partial [Prochlorotrichaceae cyanobacterium]